MRWKNVYRAALVGIVSSLLFVQNMTFSSDAYFTPQEIKGQILHTIEGAKESIDIAAMDITSNDILKALVKAKERGVQIRIAVDRKHSLTRGLLSKQYKDKEFAIKLLIQKGIMHNNFALIDCKLLITGSYSWNENVSKYNRDNAIFTDEATLLVKYQREFDRLFHEGVTPGIKEAISITKEELEREESKSEVIIPETTVHGGQVIATNYGFAITETPDGYIAMNFDEFNNIFGMASELSDDQKENLWVRCVGEKVKWNGRVNYIGWGLVTGWMLGTTHGDTSVEIKLNSANKAHFSQVKYGNTVTYTGKLNSRVTRIFPYKLEDGDVLEVVNTPPKPLSTSELVANPDIVPVSQGPKIIFIVESFDDLDSIFGKESKLSDIEKDAAWEKYVGKYVSWMGQITYKNLNVASGLRIGIMQKERAYVELKVSLAKKETVLKFQEGDTVLYTGRLTSRCGNHSPYILEDGDIMTMK